MGCRAQDDQPTAAISVAIYRELVDGVLVRIARIAPLLLVTFLCVTACTPQLTAPDVDTELVSKRCGGTATGTVAPVTQREMPSGILGTSTEDLQGFADEYNEIRLANCLATVHTTNFRLGECIEQRLIWIAEDPSEDPLSAWGHDGTERSDGKPAVGCDANLAGGLSTTGAVAAQKWWFSEAHRESLYRPDYGGPLEGVCIDFAMAHGGIPHAPANFTRAGAFWSDCEPYRDQVERGDVL